MKNYIDLVFKKEKRAISREKLYQKVERLIQEEDSSYLLSFEDKAKIDEALFKGVNDRNYYETPKQRYISLQKTSFRKGRFHGNRAGEGFVTTLTSYYDKEGKQIILEDKYTLSKDSINGAIDGDYVLIDIGSNGIKPEVVEILDRNLDNITGEIFREGSGYFVKPLDKKKRFLTIALEGEHIEGQIVSVSLVDRREQNFYIGEVTREFRHKDDPREDILLEAFKYGMPEGFSEESLKQLEYIPTSVSEDDKVGRYDFIDWNVFSIDGDDTKDKDDCISLTRLPNGNYLLGVHIADVPHYVPFNSPIDKDAFIKGTSYYFGGCVEPQLHHKLSNGICSLNDSVERLTKSILIEYDKDGNVISRSLVPSVIKSKIGMTYKKVNKILKEGIVEDEYLDYKEDLLDMANLARKLREKRISNGAIEFIRPEIKFIHDENGKVIGVDYRYQDLAENLIEEFMLAGNVNVGEILTEKNIPCIYRIHDTPNQERLEEFLNLLDAIGMSFPYSAEAICKDKKKLQLLTKHISNAGELSVVLSTNLIRCMSHASYSTRNIGHYGTGFDIYCHYTSPIRRLADLALSRIIDECYFEKDPKKKSKNIRKWRVIAHEFADQASKMERVEEEVEKNVNLMETAEYLNNFIGEEFEATIISMSDKGITVQLNNYLEGRIRTKNLPGKYVYNPATFTLLSMDGHEDYYVGDKLKVKLVDANKVNKTADFVSIEKINENRIHDNFDSNQLVKAKTKRNSNRKKWKK